MWSRLSCQPNEFCHFILWYFILDMTMNFWDRFSAFSSCSNIITLPNFLCFQNSILKIGKFLWFHFENFMKMVHNNRKFMPQKVINMGGDNTMQFTVILKEVFLALIIRLWPCTTGIWQFILTLWQLWRVTLWYIGLVKVDADKLVYQMSLLARK